MQPSEFHDGGPFGFLITFRSYGTWLHGKAGSVDRFHNRYATPTLAANRKREDYNRRLLQQRPVSLVARQRAAILDSIKETCRNVTGNYGLQTFEPTMFTV